MSTANPSPPTFGLSGAFERAVGGVLNGIQATAFWAAAFMPLALVTGLFAGVADLNLGVVGGALLANLVCAVVGHGHTPN